MQIRTLLGTHAELLRDRATSAGLYEDMEGGYGSDTVRRLIEALLRHIHYDRVCRQITVVRTGEGKRFDDCFAEFDRQLVHKHPKLDCNLCPLLGLGTHVKTKLGAVVTSEGRLHPLEGYDGLTKFITRESAWSFVQEKDAIANKILPNSYSVFFGGRLFMKLLGFEELFSIASIYELDWRKRKVRCIIPQSTLR